MRLFQYYGLAGLALLACGPQDGSFLVDTAPMGPATTVASMTEPGVAEYDAGLGVPVCWGVSNLCDSTTLVEGRGPMGPELHAPNTLDGCADGTSNEPSWHPDQIHWIRVSRADGRPFAAGRRVRVDIAVEVPRYSSGGPPSIKLFSASDATAPVWTYLKTISFQPESHPEQQGFAVGSVEYVLPSGSLQAVRARFGPGSTYPAPCGTSTIEDRDDLVFAVGQEVDQTPPTVSFTAPSNNAPVTTPATLTATADDDFDVTSVGFYDGETLIGWDTTPPFSMEWYNGTLPQGPRTLTAKAYDAAGHVSAPATVSVIIDHVKPWGWISSPASEAFIRGTVQLTASASDANGIKAVSFYDGPVEFNGLLGYATAAPYTVSWDTTKAHNGRRGLWAVATDRAGNVSAIDVVGVTVDNVPPTVAITAPLNGAKVFLSTTLQATASDDNAVTQVAFYDGTKLIGTDTTAPYSVNWSTLFVPKGQHTLTAHATDVAGNVTSSAGIVVTVQ